MSNLIRCQNGHMFSSRRYGKLWKFINASGYTYTYAYNENGKLESVLTPRGIIGVKNEYDPEGRVLKQTMPDGSVVELRQALS